MELMYKKEDEWTPCFDVPNVKLPSVTYLGFSAETGELSDNFDIIKVETRNLYSAGGQQAQRDQSRNKYKSSATRQKSSSSGGGGGGWGWFFLKIVLFGLVLAGAYVGFTMYRTNRRRDRF